MKTLIINRHAKSSWKNEGQLDFDRPLNERGMRDAPEMGSLLKKRHAHIDCFISSPANRALSTARIMAEKYGYDLSQIKEINQIYGASFRELLEVIGQFDNSWKTVIFFGHNPAMSTLASYLTNEDLMFPTCGVAAIEFEIDSWAHMSRDLGQLSYFDYPKNHPFAHE